MPAATIELAAAPDGRRFLFEISDRQLRKWESRFPDVDILKAVATASRNGLKGIWHGGTFRGRLEVYLVACQQRAATATTSQAIAARFRRAS